MTESKTTLKESKIGEGSRSLFPSVLRVMFSRGLGPLSSFVLMYLLASVLGAEASGAFYLSLTMMMLLSIVARFGFDTALQRFAGSAAIKCNWSEVLGIYRKAMIISMIISTLIALLLFVLSPLLAPTLLKSTDHLGVMITVNTTIVPFTLLGVQAAMLKAMGKPALGGFIEVAALPTLTILLVITVSLFTSFSVFTVAVCYLTAASLTALLGIITVRMILPEKVDITSADTKTLLSSCIPLTLVELMNFALLWTPFLFLGVYASGAEAGSYNVAHRLSAQLGLLTLVFSSITAPRYAAHHENGDLPGLLELAKRSTQMLVMIGLPPIILLVLWPDLILQIFGTEFTAASNALIILTVGQLVNILTGPVGYILAMTGHEKMLRNILAFTTVFAIILSALLIPVLGATGAALAAASALIFNKFLCSLQLHRLLRFPFFLVFDSMVNKRWI